MTKDEAVILAGLTRLMAQWSSLALQTRFVHAVGVAIDPADVQPLYMLGITGERRAGDLASDLHVSRPTMSKQLTRLASAGLIAKSPDPDDGRATLVSLTDAGARAYDALVDRGLHMMHQIMVAWQPEERRRMAQLVDRFVTTAGTIAADMPDTRTSDGDPVGSNPDVPDTRDRP